MVIIGLVGRISCGKEVISSYIEKNWQFISKKITSYNSEEILELLQHEEETKDNNQNIETKDITDNKVDIANINKNSEGLEKISEKNQEIEKDQILKNNEIIEKNIIQENKEDPSKSKRIQEIEEIQERKEIKDIKDPQSLKENKEKNNVTSIEFSKNILLEESNSDFKNIIFPQDCKKKSLDECKLSLIDYKTNQIIFPIISMEQVIFMRKRNYFHLVYVDTPILMRFKFFQRKYKKKLSLEEFIKLDDLVTTKKYKKFLIC